MPGVLQVDTRALSSTSPSGRTSFWPWNSGCSYRIQLWAQRAKGHRVGGCTQSLVGLLQASPPSSPPGSQPGPPLPGHPLTSLAPPLRRPQGPSLRHLRCPPRPPCFCPGSRALRRESPGKTQRESSGPVPGHCPLPASICPQSPTFPGLVFSLPWVFSAGLWNREGVQNPPGSPLPLHCSSENPRSCSWPPPPGHSPQRLPPSLPAPRASSPCPRSWETFFPQLPGSEDQQAFGIYTLPLSYHGHQGPSDVHLLGSTKLRPKPSASWDPASQHHSLQPLKGKPGTSQAPPRSHSPTLPGAG